jgi:hypothetical protein
MGSSIIRTVFEFIAAGIQSAGPSPVEDADGHALAVISLLAFSSGGQVAMARGLQVTEITTAMATAAYVDIFID